ncbi:glycosyltransferase [Streptomyces sp. SAI-127]|uniref:glycosyltransferase n=1 Tax=Streptomyces sp. SAI-127 TaxID=2940543 RepID=UPI0024767880|nr:glycosyltransferase [Streptomyces sp. SAI-127]MDH6484543.1 UDP:flavonoid glycosyltransferase YjiC (YdhE family) [Streptomyces sp. SAI-127]
MRILFSAPGSAAHVFPMVPTAQALRSAGHDVLFAGQAPVTVLRPTGFPLVEVGDGTTTAEIFARFSTNGPKELTQEEINRLAVIGFTEHSRSALDDLVRLAETWRPDMIVHATMQGTAPLVAAALGIPTVVHNFGVTAGLPYVEGMAAELADEYRARGVTGPPERTVLDVVPASLGGDGTGWRVRYVPFNGGGPVPADLVARGGRQRVVVTLGTALSRTAGARYVDRLIEQAATVDADFLLALGGADLAPLGELPPNVKPLSDWVPLAQLLAGCDAVVHHGGAGTMMAAAAVGIPQLFLPSGADHFTNAAAATAQGFALRAEPQVVDGDLLDTLLNDDALRKAALAMRDEIAGLPSPADLVGDIEDLTTAAR